MSFLGWEEGTSTACEMQEMGKDAQAAHGRALLCSLPFSPPCLVFLQPLLHGNFAGWQKLTAAFLHLHYISPEYPQVWGSLVTTAS